MIEYGIAMNGKQKTKRNRKTRPNRKHEELLSYKNLEKQNFFISQICNSIHDQKTYGKFNEKKETKLLFVFLIEVRI